MIEGLILATRVNRCHDSLCMDEVVVTEDGRVMLCELGEEVLESKRSSVTPTPYWLSPEKIMGKGVDAKSDVWTLAIYVWEAIESDPPYMEFPLLKALFFTSTKGVPELKKPELLSDELKAFLARCLVKEPEKRPSFQELALVCDRSCVDEERRRGISDEEGGLRDGKKRTIKRIHFLQRRAAKQSLCLSSSASLSCATTSLPQSETETCTDSQPHFYSSIVAKNSFGPRKSLFFCPETPRKSLLFGPVFSPLVPLLSFFPFLLFIRLYLILFCCSFLRSSLFNSTLLFSPALTSILPSFLPSFLRFVVVFRCNSVSERAKLFFFFIFFFFRQTTKTTARHKATDKGEKRHAQDGVY